MIKLLIILRETLLLCILVAGAALFTAPLEGAIYTLPVRLLIGIPCLLIALSYLSSCIKRADPSSERYARDAKIAMVPMCLGFSALPFLGYLLIPMEMAWSAAVLGERLKVPFLQRLRYTGTTRLLVLLLVLLAHLGVKTIRN